MRSNLDTAPSHVFLKFHFEKDEKGQPDKAKKLQANFLKEFFHHPLTISVIYNIGYLQYRLFNVQRHGTPIIEWIIFGFTSDKKAGSKHPIIYGGAEIANILNDMTKHLTHMSW